MKSIRSKLMISVGVIVFIFSAVLFYRTYYMITTDFENLTKQQLDLALNFELAIREYVAEKVRPLMFDLVPEGEFFPETMSTSFVARNIFEKVRAKFPDYIIKFSARNPRNRVNLAGLAELKMIDYFNDNPQEKTWTGEIPIEGKPYFAKFSAMRMEKSCLHCHGDPADAPAALKKIYGSTEGFHLPLGKVIGLDTIAIPSNIVTEQLWNETIQNFAVLGTGLLLLFISLFFAFRFVITERLGKITEHFLHAEGQKEDVTIKTIEIGGQDEITILTNSFNRLADKLNDSYSALRRTKETLRQSEGRLSEINKCFLNFGVDPLENINRLTMLCGKLTGADCSLYNRLEGDMLCSWGQWNMPPGYNPVDKPDGHICYDVIKNSGEKVLVVTNLPETHYARTDPNVIPCKLKTYVGIAVKFRDNNAGSLCTVYQDDFIPGEADKRVMEIIASAIGVEEERKHAEEKIKTSLIEKEVLLSEVHHRVKNNFEIISSLLDMSSMNTDNQEAQSLWKDARSRIHSMALIHSQLYENDRFDNIDMERHVRQLVDHLSHLYSETGKHITLTIESSNVYLSVNQAIPCALMLNELIANAYRHAFKKSKQGTIHISIDHSESNTVLIKIKDNGEGIPEEFDLTHSAGLGLKLVKHLVTAQLKGNVRFNQNYGTEVHLEFKKH